MLLLLAANVVACITLLSTWHTAPAERPEVACNTTAADDSRMDEQTSGDVPAVQQRSAVGASKQQQKPPTLQANFSEALSEGHSAIPNGTSNWTNGTRAHKLPRVTDDMCTHVASYDVHGHDVGEQRLESVGACCDACSKREDCEMAVHSARMNTCFMKSAGGAPVLGKRSRGLTLILMRGFNLDTLPADLCAALQHGIRHEAEQALRAPWEVEGTLGSTLMQRDSTKLRPGITLCLHGDISRINIMLRSRQQWAASVALAVLVRNASEMAIVERRLLREELDVELGLLRWNAYLPPRQSPCTGPCQGATLTNDQAWEIHPGQSLWSYPANIMRNLALRLVETTQVLLLDADFIPSTSMRSVARQGIPLARQQVLLLPPFQLDGAHAVTWAAVPSLSTNTKSYPNQWCRLRMSETEKENNRDRLPIRFSHIFLN